jgi:hypothetical protein
MATVNFRLHKNTSIKVRITLQTIADLELNTGFNQSKWLERQRPILSSTKTQTGTKELGKEFDEHQKFKQDLFEI